MFFSLEGTFASPEVIKCWFFLAISYFKMGTFGKWLRFLPKVCNWNWKNSESAKVSGQLALLLLMFSSTWKLWTTKYSKWCILGLHEFISQVPSWLTSFSISSLTSSPITMSNIYAKVDQYSLSMLLEMKILPRLRQGPEPKYRGGTSLLCSLPEIRGSDYIISNSNLNASLLASRPYLIFANKKKPYI